MSSNKGILLLTAIGAVATAQTASAQTLNSFSLVGYSTPDSGGINSLQYAGANDNTTAFAQVNGLQFTGMDGNGNQQTMAFSGWAKSQSDYGQLHNSTYVSVTNNYYNASNPDYDPSTGMGSPNSEDTLGFSQFTDTLQYGGLLSSGYKASYVFHIDGSVTGNLTEYIGLTLAGTVAGNYFINAWIGNGTYSANYGTAPVSVNGTYAQTVNVQFDTQAYVDNYWYADGSNLAGESDFSDTGTLAGIYLYNPAGQLVTNGVTITSASGVSYQLLPEPSTWAVMGVGVLGLLRARRRRS